MFISWLNFFLRNAALSTFYWYFSIYYSLILVAWNFSVIRIQSVVISDLACRIFVMRKKLLKVSDSPKMGGGGRKHIMKFHIERVIPLEWRDMSQMNQFPNMWFQLHSSENRIPKIKLNEPSV
jgi:hypothetical protein